MGFLLLVADGDWRPLTSLIGFFMSCPSGAPDPSGSALRSTGPGYAFLLGGGLQGNAVRKTVFYIPTRKQTRRSRSVKRQGAGEGGRQRRKWRRTPLPVWHGWAHM